MASYNKVILAGNLTRDPQLSYLPSGTAVCEFGLAMNRKWKGQDGQLKEETCFVDCRAFGRGGETINQYMTKGQPILVDGHLRFEQWESKEGQKRSRLSVVVDNFQFLGGPRREGGPEGGGGWSRGAGGNAGGGGGRGRAAGGGSRPSAAPVDEESPPAMDEPSGDDIPF
ncbi:MAG: single-stranded DNA-binding protein [Phycisphaerae bacterium]